MAVTARKRRTRTVLIGESIGKARILQQPRDFLGSTRPHQD
ncbi:hypothetical protein LI90_2287 [Carbonactinospora thermoautotrophica]|uniref:Uncharacterized protein n=1 Tax=Carbonactinospora thermoautotrophica TaxID=1469144 RepID=A0A132MTU3_9ACTN|nr:hypothetical protein LI90_2287 [Carbonactinospora thermoautotrophica]